jgi:hypothetical protein
MADKAAEEPRLAKVRGYPPTKKGKQRKPKNPKTQNPKTQNPKPKNQKTKTFFLDA